MRIFDVFISYRRTDGLIIAEALYKYLTSKGLRVFFDKHEMIDGHYFTTQIETNLKIAPNYILVATGDVFKFREKEDWLRKELEVAIKEYESNPIERTLTALVPESVIFPEKDILPKSVCNIADAQRITLPYGEDFTETFYKTLKAVTNINRRNLWFAAHRWLENSKQLGGRFASLNINESILPNASKNKKEKKTMPIKVYSKENESENRQSLLDAMDCSYNHLYLIGQGGIGKTTALMHIMNNAYVDKQYSENAQIPLFVELSFAPDTYGALYEGGKSSFIRRSIYKQVRTDRTIKQVTAKEVSDVDEVFSSLPYDVAVQPITDILSKTTPAPEYLLLLDGLNEVSSVTIDETGLSVVQMIMREIDFLISECPNVRIVLTSRSDESAIYNESITRLYLSGVEEEIIKEYLESCEISKELIDEALEDENLCETLQIPLFLTMYVSLSKYDEVSTQGEILKLFFNERRKNIFAYTMQERLTQVEKNITDVASAVQKNRMDADMQNFILDFILPEIAWRMERNNNFYLHVREIKKIIEPVLQGINDLSVCGEFGRELFYKYRNGASAKMHTLKVANRILERLGDDIMEVTESIINCCVFALGVIQESNGKYGFVHQHIRNYFAAVKNINTLRLSVYLYEEDEKELALECMNEAFKDEPVNYSVRRFMGEYLGEHRNKPYYANGKWNYGVPTGKCDRNLIKRALDIYRGYFDGECGYGIASFIRILISVRKNLSGSDFSNLDLKYCCFNYNTILGQPSMNTSFNDTKLYDYNFIDENFSSNIKSASMSSDGSRISILYTDGKVIVWDRKHKIQLKRISCDNIELSEVRYSPDGKILICSSADKTWLFDSYTFRKINISSEIKMISFSKDSKYFCGINEDDEIEMFNEKGESFSKIDCKNNLYSKNIAFYKNYSLLHYIESIYLLNSSTIIFVLKNGDVCCLDPTDSNDINVKIKSKTGILGSCISKDEKYISILTKDKIITYAIGTWIEFSSISLEKLDASLNDSLFLAFVEDKLLLIQKWLGTLKLIDVKEGIIFLCQKFNKEINADLSSCSKEIVLYNKKDIYLFDSESLVIRDVLKGYFKHGDCLSCSQGNVLVFPTSDRMIKCYDMRQKKVVEQIEGLPNTVNYIEYSDDGNYLVAFCKDSKVAIWNNVDSHSTPLIFNTFSDAYSFDIGAETKKCLVACNERTYLLDLVTGDTVFHFSKQKGRVNCAKFSSDESFILTASDSYVKIYDTLTGNVVKTFANPIVTNKYNANKSLRAMSICNVSNNIFAVKFINEDIIFYSLESYKCLNILSHTDYYELNNKKDYIASQYLLNSIAGEIYENGYIFPYDYDGFVSETGQHMIMLTNDRQQVLLFYGDKFNNKITINTNLGVIYSVRFSPDEKWILIAGKRAISLISINDCSSVTVCFDNDNVKKTFFTKDGLRIVVLLNNGIVKVLDTLTFNQIDKIQLLDGQNVLNVDLREIRHDSELSKDKKSVLKQYGAIIE